MESALLTSTSVVVVVLLQLIAAVGLVAADASRIVCSLRMPAVHHPPLRVL